MLNSTLAHEMSFMWYNSNYGNGALAMFTSYGGVNSFLKLGGTGGLTGILSSFLVQTIYLYYLPFP